MSRLRIVLAAVLASAVVAVGVPAIASKGDVDYSNPAGCSQLLRGNGGAVLTRAQHRQCIRAIATTYLDGQQGRIPASRMLLDPSVVRYPLGPKPSHENGGAAKIRDSLPTSTTKIGRLEWVIDGNQAFVSYTIFTKASRNRPATYETDRITIRRGLIWEIVFDISEPVSPVRQGDPMHVYPALALTPGHPTVPSRTPDYDDAEFCSVWMAEHPNGSLTYSQHRRCMIAIASTYIDAEQNTLPGWKVLFDPRATRHRPGEIPGHAPGGGDAIRAGEGYTGVNIVIKRIARREWTVDGDMAWIRYDGYLQSSTTEPGFYVMERFTIRNGLIWQIMVPLAVNCTPGPCGQTNL